MVFCLLKTRTHTVNEFYDALCLSRDKLCVVVFVPRQQAPLAPAEEAAEGDLRVGAHIYVIFVRPDIHTDQHHTDADGAVQLV